MLSRAIVAVALFTGCATAGQADDHVVALVDAGTPPTQRDAPTNTNPPPGPDASSTTPPPSCTQQTTDLLANGKFDTGTAGTGWNQTPADPTYPIVGSDIVSGYTADSTPNVAWMGGVTTSSDSMYQDVQVPAGTTSLELKGMYLVLTSETVTTAKDKSSVELRTTSGTKIESVLAVDNTGATTSWTSLDHTFANPSAGTTVRLYLSSSNTGGTATNMKVTDFFYDSLQLLATHCD